MRTFPDLLETVVPVANAAARQLTTVANVKAMLGITDTSSDTLLGQLIDRVSGQIAGYCRLARDVVGNRPTLGAESLRATWYAPTDFPNYVEFRNVNEYRRGPALYLPWRVPITAIIGVIEDGTDLVLGTDYKFIGGFSGRLERLDAQGRPAFWSPNAIVVEFDCGWSLPTDVPPEIEAACIDQIRYVFLGRKRDPAIRSEAVQEVATVSYSVPGGDAIGDSGLLPNVEAALQDYRNPVP